MIVTGTSNVHAQLAFRLGVNQATISSELNTENISSITGFQLGITYTDDVVEKVSLRPGLLYSRKGFGNAPSKLLLNYLEVPLDLVYHVYENDFFGMHLHGGLYYGLLLNAAQEVAGVSTALDLSSGFIKRGDLGVNVGFTVDIDSFFIGFNAAFALSKLNPDEEDSIKNRNLSILVGYSFSK